MQTYFRSSTLSITACLIALATAQAQAADIDPSQLTNQAEFRLLSEDMGAALSFKPMIPAESMGLTGFDVGVALSTTRLENRDVWRKAAGGASIPASVLLPTLHIHKGLLFDIDLGASLLAVPNSNIKMFGGELRWAVLPGGAATPAVALRASFSALSGVSQLGFRTVGLDASISKGFMMLTPYAGVGIVRVTSSPDASTNLSQESFSQNKIFAGVNLNLGLTNWLFEADRTGEASSYGVKMGWRF